MRRFPSRLWPVKGRHRRPVEHQGATLGYGKALERMKSVQVSDDLATEVEQLAHIHATVGTPVDEARANLDACMARVLEELEMGAAFEAIVNAEMAQRFDRIFLVGDEEGNRKPLAAELIDWAETRLGPFQPFTPTAWVAADYQRSVTGESWEEQRATASSALTEKTGEWSIADLVDFAAEVSA